MITNFIEHDKSFEIATFAGGPFWFMVDYFEKLDGVVKIKAGYTGGEKEHPTHGEVLSGKTGHREAVQLIFDPHKLTYEQLLAHYWHQIDPTDREGQFRFRENAYLTAIFYHHPNQENVALRSKQRIEESGRFSRPIVTEIVPASAFYLASEVHQQFHKKHPFRYKLQEARLSLLIWHLLMYTVIILRHSGFTSV